MTRLKVHREEHSIGRIGWLRAAVLGANDGLVSTASLVVGVAAATVDKSGIILAGVAGLTAGAMSMAAGEYVSVSSQSDTEKADRAREEAELRDSWDSEVEELTAIYEGRGLDRELAEKVAQQLMERDALGAHLRDELGISAVSTARPVQAALTSAATFAVGAGLPLGVAVAVPVGWLIAAVSAATLVFLALLGAIGAWTGGASPMRGAIRVAFWGAVAMAATAAIGALFGTTIA